MYTIWYLHMNHVTKLILYVWPQPHKITCSEGGSSRYTLYSTVPVFPGSVLLINKAKTCIPSFLRLRIVLGLAITLILEMLWKAMGRKAHSSEPCSQLTWHRAKEQQKGAEGHPAMLPAPLLCMFSALLNLLPQLLNIIVYSQPLSGSRTALST